MLHSLQSHISHPKLTLFPYRQQTKQIADDYKAREESWTKTQSEFEEKIKHEIDRAEKSERYINEHLANAVEEAFKNCMGQRAVQFYLDRMVFIFHVTIMWFRFVSSSALDSFIVGVNVWRRGRIPHLHSFSWSPFPSESSILQRSFGKKWFLEEIRYGHFDCELRLTLYSAPPALS